MRSTLVIITIFVAFIGTLLVVRSNANPLPQAASSAAPAAIPAVVTMAPNATAVTVAGATGAPKRGGCGKGKHQKRSVAGNAENLVIALAKEDSSSDSSSEEKTKDKKNASGNTGLTTKSPKN